MIEPATSWTEPSSLESILGVNPFETILRSRACRGSSIAIIELKNSLNSGGLSRIVIPCAELKMSGFREA